MSGSLLSSLHKRGIFLLLIHTHTYTHTHTRMRTLYQIIPQTFKPPEWLHKGDYSHSQDAEACRRKLSICRTQHGRLVCTEAAAATSGRRAQHRCASFPMVRISKSWAAGGRLLSSISAVVLTDYLPLARVTLILVLLPTS